MPGKNGPPTHASSAARSSACGCSASGSLVERDRRWLRARPVGVERALRPTLHPFVLRLGDERSTNVLVRFLRQLGHLSDPGFRIPQRAGDPDTLRCGVLAVAGKQLHPGGEIVDTALSVTTRRSGDAAHPVQHRDAAQQRIDVLRKRDAGCLGNGQRRIGHLRRLVIDHVVQRHGVLERRREIRRCDQYPRGVSLDSLSAVVERHLRTHRPIRCVVAPAVVIHETVERRTRGNRLRLAKPAEHDQSAGGVSQKVADRHVHVHESSVQPFHSLARPADRVGPCVNDQVFLRRVLVAPRTRLGIASLSGGRSAAAFRFTRCTSHSIRACAAVISRTDVTAPALLDVYS